MRWGWTNAHFLGVHSRLKHMARCYEEIPKRHPDVLNAMENPKVKNIVKKEKTNRKSVLLN
jgi:hypothetical protein